MNDGDEITRARLAQRGSPFLSPEQAAHYLGLSTRTLQEYRSAGTGPRFRRHSRHVRYHIDDLDGWSKGVAESGGHD
ncbi:helix-turn-helix domain-containing protein [Sphingomonas sp. GlSt437]|uniref:helix-turn-helix domain-containing protein n=1 Tax=Sphingomonas sp. GlSt437 TaxID=3389970 RepID=UPI003A8BBFFB